MLAVMAYYTDLSFDQSRNNHFPQPSNNPYRPLRSELSDPKFEDHAPPNIYAGFYPSTDGPSVEVPSFTSWRALVERGIKVVTNLGHSPTLATKSFARADDKLELLELVRQSVPVVLLVMIDDKEFVLKIVTCTLLFLVILSHWLTSLVPSFPAPPKAVFAMKPKKQPTSI